MREIKCLDEKPKIKKDTFVGLFVSFYWLGSVNCKQLKSVL